MNTILLVLALAASQESTPQAGQRYDYFNYATNQKARFAVDEFSVDTRRRIYWRGHAGVSLSLCLPEDRYYCFGSPALSFAVPKTQLTSGQSWEREGQAFRVVGERELKLLGSDVKASVIESTAGDGSAVRFFYSHCFGLVAIAFESDDEGGPPELFFSGSKYGFPIIAPSCSECTASKLEAAVSAALADARTCGVELEKAEMTIKIEDPNYEIYIFVPGTRGGAAKMLANRSTAEIMSVECEQ